MKDLFISGSCKDFCIIQLLHCGNLIQTCLVHIWWENDFIACSFECVAVLERAKRELRTIKLANGQPSACSQSVPTWNRKPQQQWGQDCVLTTWQWKMTGNMGGHKVAKPPSGGRVLEGPFVQSAEGWRIKDSEQLRKNHFGINSFLLKCGSSTAHTYKSHKHVHNYVYSLPMHVCDA